MRRSGGCLVRSRESSVLLSTCQGQAPVRFLCKVGWVGNAKVLLDVDVCVAWCHVATIKTCTAGQACQYSARPVLESNEDHGNRPGSRDFGHSGQQIDHMAIVDNSSSSLFARWFDIIADRPQASNVLSPSTRHFFRRTHSSRENPELNFTTRR